VGIKNQSKFTCKEHHLAYELKNSSLHLEYWKAFQNPLKFVPPQRSSTVNRSSLKLSSQEELYNHLATRILQKKIFFAVECSDLSIAKIYHLNYNFCTHYICRTFQKISRYLNKPAATLEFWFSRM